MRELATARYAGASSACSTVLLRTRLGQSILKAEKKRREIGYWELAERLTAMGKPETDRNIANKISRDGSAAAFFSNV